MRIILAHKFFKYTGGADVFFFEVGRILEANGHQVAYFSTQDKDNLPCAYSSYFTHAPDFKTSNPLKKALAFAKIPYNLESKRKFEQLIIDFKPDLIHVFNIITHISPAILDVGKKYRIPIVMSCNDYKHICPNSSLFNHKETCEDCQGKAFYHCIKNKCSHESTVFSIANSVEAYIHKWLNIYKKNIDLFLFSSQFMTEKTKEFWGEHHFSYGKLVNPFNIPLEEINPNIGEYALYFGRLGDEKGVDRLLNALCIHPSIPLKIVGSGPELDKLKNIATKGQLSQVTFLGPLWGEEINKVLYHAKFVVVPSIWYENFPYVILQAFAAGKPVLGSNRGGIPELIGDQERGLICDINNPIDIADKLQQLFSQDELCLSLGKNARNYVVENFNDTIFYSQLIKQYHRVLTV